MKKILFLLFFAAIVFVGCKKAEQTGPTAVTPATEIMISTTTKAPAPVVKTAPAKRAVKAPVKKAVRVKK